MARFTTGAAVIAYLGLTAAHAQTPALRPLEKMPPTASYQWKNVVIRAGGFVSGIEFSPAQSQLVYARTDVGGAYRSDDGGERWLPLTDPLRPGRYHLPRYRKHRPRPLRRQQGVHRRGHVYLQLGRTQRHLPFQ